MLRARVLLPVVVLLLCILAPATASAVGFNSPSGNIGCQLFSDLVRCDIIEKDWSPPPKPRSCELEWGMGLQIRRGQHRGRFVCAGDTALERGKPLRYGETIRRGGIRCTSKPSGMRCRLRNGHGFFISRGSYKRF